MAKRTKSTVGEYIPKPTVYLNSQTIRIPNSIKNKVGKNVTLKINAKVISQRLNKELGKRQSESYDLEIRKIVSGRRK